MKRGFWPLVAVLLLGFAASLVANWPGHFPPDAVWQLAQGRSGLFNLWHPPVMAWMLGLADAIWPGASLFMVFDTALFFIALGAFATLRGRPGAIGLIVLAIIAASPLVLIYQGLVLKDVLFADASAAGFAALAWAGRLWERPWVRGALVGVVLALFTLAALVRQNGAIVAVAGALALGAIVWMKSGKTSAFPALSVVGALVCMAVMDAGVSQALAAHSDHKPATAQQLTSLRLYDLAGAVRRQPDLSLQVLDARAPAAAQYIRQVAPLWDPTRVDPLVLTPGWVGFMEGAGPAVGAQWRALVFAHPGLYLAVRAEVFKWAFMTPRLHKCAPIIVGVDSQDPDLLEEAGLAERYTDKDDWDTTYSEAFEGTPLYSHVFFAALAVGLLLLACRDLARGGGAELIAVIGMLTSALVFVASFFVISLACDYRYLYFLDVAAMAALAHRVAAWGIGGRGRNAFFSSPKRERRVV
jgi:hypothetical protein